MRCTPGRAAPARRTAATATAMLGVGGDHAEGESYAYGRRDESPVEVHNHSPIASAAQPGALPGIEQHEPVKKADEISMSNDLANGTPLNFGVFPGSRPRVISSVRYKGRLGLPA
jgi:hypothetical protein